MTAFRRDPEITRQISFVDLLLAALATFVLAPLLSLGIGFGLLVLTGTSEPSPVWHIAGVFVGFGYTGILAWVGMPFALLFGWWATRRGWVGWGSAIGSGAIAAVICSLPLSIGTPNPYLNRNIADVLLSFAALGAIYGLIAYLALIWLKKDLLGRKAGAAE